MDALDTEKSALVVVDMQNDFCHPDGALYAPASEAAIEPVNSLVGQARQADVPVFFTQDGHYPTQFMGDNNYDEYERWGKHAQVGSWGYELHDDVIVNMDDDIGVGKDTYDAFYQTDFEPYLRQRFIDTLVICGTLANVCVLHTASSAALHGYRPIVVEDAVGYIDEADKEYALEHIDFLFGETASRNEIQYECESAGIDNRPNQEELKDVIESTPTNDPSDDLFNDDDNHSNQDT